MKKLTLIHKDLITLINLFFINYFGVCQRRSDWIKIRKGKSDPSIRMVLYKSINRAYKQIFWFFLIQHPMYVMFFSSNIINHSASVFRMFKNLCKFVVRSDNSNNFTWKQMSLNSINDNYLLLFHPTTISKKQLILVPEDVVVLFKIDSSSSTTTSVLMNFHNNYHL